MVQCKQITQQKQIHLPLASWEGGQPKVYLPTLDIQTPGEDRCLKHQRLTFEAPKAKFTFVKHQRLFFMAGQRTPP